MSHPLLEQVGLLVKELFDQVQEDQTHGFGHAVRVCQLARHGVMEYCQKKILHTDQIMAVLLAALLHDVDDPKVFKNSIKNLPNARSILEMVEFSLIDDVLDMITLVSFSKNGNSVVYRSDNPHQYHRSPILWSQQDYYRPRYGAGTHGLIPKWKLIPRDADRLEALGSIGIARCFAYGVQKGRALYCSETPRLKTRQDLHKMSARYFLSKQYPDTTIDYFIAELIPRQIMSSGMVYFEKLAIQRTSSIIRVCLLLGQHDHLTHAMIRDCMTMDPDALELFDKWAK